jgi:hypothetical protein
VPLLTDSGVNTCQVLDHAASREGFDLILRLLRRALVVSFVFALTSSKPLAAQTAPRLQVFGSYSHLRFDSKKLGFADYSDLNGGNVGFIYNLNPYFGGVGEIGGDWGAPWKFYDAMAGPRFSYPRGKLTLFGEALFGKAKAHIAIPNEPNGGQSDSALAIDLGGGLDYRLTPRFSVRVIQADYLRSKVFGNTEGNLRFSVGIVYNMGQVGRKRHRLP